MEFSPGGSESFLPGGDPRHPIFEVFVTDFPPAQIDRILEALGHAGFIWDIGSDRMAWSEGVATLFPERNDQALACGHEFAKRIEPHRSARFDAILDSPARDSGAGVPYQLEYAVRFDGAARATWVEETGRWFAGPNGQPARAEGVIRAIDERHARDEKLLRLSERDLLTGELNRAHLLGALTTALDDATRSRKPFAFLVVAIDHLARINEAFGFDVGDEAICEVSKRLRATLRGGDVIGRFSGNKIGLILKACSADDMQVAAARFLAAVREQVVPTKSGPVSVTASIGGVNIPRFARTTDEIINRAQEALDMAKARQGSPFIAWLPNVEREAQRRVNIRVTDEIIRAVNERRIVVAFEPVVSAASRESAFYESLVRMQQDDGLALAPDIVPVAERLGLIRLVDHRVLELVLAELQASPDVTLSLNISPDTTTDPDWWATMEAGLQNNRSIAERLIVEITETVAIRHLDDVKGIVKRLKNQGCRIAIDDFGAGYTSFRNLRKLDVDIVKIDGAFVQHIVESSDDRAFVQTLIDLARRLGLKTVAEWVQDEQAASLLQQWGCDYIQGRFIGLASDQRPWLAPAQSRRLAASA